MSRNFEVVGEPVKGFQQENDSQVCHLVKDSVVTC